eukprot:5102166-Karenia_brevis.AAC.1
MGASIHDIPASDRKWIAKQTDDDVASLKEMARALHAWPEPARLFGALRRAEADEKVSRPKKCAGHEMSWESGTWRCRLCNAKPRGRAQLTTKCPKMNGKLCKVLDDPQGHKLVQAWEGQLEHLRSVIWCTRCGCYAHFRPQGLAKPCRGRAGKAGSRALKAFCDGLHPESQLPLGSHSEL